MNYTFIDHIIELEMGKRLLAAKNIARTEDYLDEYYPRLGSLPGALIVESMAATAGLLLLATTNFSNLALLAMIEKAEFMHPVQPGDRMLVKAEMLALHGTAARLEAAVRVGQMPVAGATLVLGLFEIQSLENPQMKSFFASLLARTRYWLQRDLNRQEDLLAGDRYRDAWNDCNLAD